MNRGGWPPLLLAAGSLPIYAVGFGLAGGRHPSLIYPLLFYPLCLAWLLAAAWVWRRGGLGMGPVLIFALAFRLLAAGDPPSLSSDIHRYAWDGRVQRAGESPYRYPPEDPALAALRDPVIYPQINRPWARTIYPPGAQLLYRVLPDDITGIRLVMIAMDLLTVGLIARLLAGFSLDPARSVLYAWSPFSVYEVGNNGHLEAAMLPLLLGAALAVRAGWHRRAGLLWGAATAMKLYPALAALALARRAPRRVLGWGLALVVLLYAGYAWSAGADVLGFLPEYVGSAEDHNIGLRRVVEWALSALVERPRAPAFAACAAALGLGGLLIVRRGGDVALVMLRLVGLYLLTLPTAFHPWYALWLLPWLCVHPRASWLWLIAALPLSYLKYATEDGIMPPWVVPLELIPTLALLALESRRSR